MKKGRLLLLLPIFFLFGCGGGGNETPNANGGGSDLTPDNDVTFVATMGNITITFPPAGKSPAAALTNGTATHTRNGARIVVRKSELVTNLVEDMGEECDVNGDCWDVGLGTYTDVPLSKETYRQIKDVTLDESGAGVLSIDVPAGLEYTIEALTFLSGNYAANLDLKMMMEYGTAITDISMGPNPANNVTITLAAVAAELKLPPTVVAGSSYAVSVESKSAALRDDWLVRQQQTAFASDLSLSWFISESVDKGTAGKGSITLTAPVYTGTTVVDKLWHHGQFFINANLLKTGENYMNWTFGSSVAGDFNPLGTVTITVI
jgi:hypothetical protein